MKTVVKRKKFECYKKIPFRGAGKGIGNLEADSYLRYGMDSRNEIDTIRDMELDKYRFHKTFRNFHDPNTVHLPFQIGKSGIDTRNLDKYSKLEYY